MYYEEKRALIHNCVDYAVCVCHYYCLRPIPPLPFLMHLTKGI